MNCALDPELEAAALCAFIEAQVLEYETLQEQLDSMVQAQNDAIEAGLSAISQEKAALLADEFTADVLLPAIPGRLKRRPSNPFTRLRILSSTGRSIGHWMTGGSTISIQLAWIGCWPRV
jgi:hypothetical protein